MSIEKEKKPRTPAQEEAFKKAREARLANMKSKKSSQEEPEVEEVVVKTRKDPHKVKPKITKVKFEPEEKEQKNPEREQLQQELSQSP